MKKSQEASPAAMEPRDVEALMTMAEIVLLAGGAVPTVRAEPHGAPAGSTLGVHARMAHDTVQHARYLLSQQQVLGPTRLSLPKRVLLRVSRLFTYRLVAASQSLADAIDHLVRVHDEALDEVERVGNSLRAQIASVEISAQDAIDSLAGRMLTGGTADDGELTTSRAAHESRLAMLEGRLAEVERERAADRAEILRLRNRSSVERGAQSGSTAPSEGTTPVLDDDTYTLFERRFRGSREEIRTRQLDSLRFVSSLAGTDRPLLDLGCGRGEWLDVLRSADIPAYGVDSNSAMIAEAVDVGLDARCEDAISHLRSVPENSLGGVSAFHFVEHIPVSVLTQVLQAANLALAPGGVLMLETPNPTNLVVGAASFYLDPTHLRPVHPDFLSFLAEACGFEDVEVHYIHPVIEPDVLHEGAAPIADKRMARVVESSEWALFGAQDYVVVARKAGGQE